MWRITLRRKSQSLKATRFENKRCREFSKRSKIFLKFSEWQEIDAKEFATTSISL